MWLAFEKVCFFAAVENVSIDRSRQVEYGFKRAKYIDLLNRLKLVF